MKMIRAFMLLLAVLLPTSWTIARADDMKEGDKPAETKKGKKKAKKKEGGDMGDMKGMDKK
jgi:hypothetical protein